MSSANDNIAFKDGGDLPYKLRTKDVSSGQDGSLQLGIHAAVPFPVDYGVGGIYHTTSKNGGTMAAALAANAPIYSFRNPSATLNALITRVKMSAWSLTGFAAGLATFDLFAARSFTVADSGGTVPALTGNNAKDRTSMTTCASVIRLSQTATLSAGTRTLDSSPIESVQIAITNAANTPFLSLQKLFETLAGDHPLLLAQNEGFVIQASVPGTGTWGFQVTTEWAEAPLVNY